MPALPQTLPSTKQVSRGFGSVQLNLFDRVIRLADVDPVTRDLVKRRERLRLWHAAGAPEISAQITNRMHAVLAGRV